MHDDPARRRPKPTEADLPPRPTDEVPEASARNHGAGTPDGADAYFRAILENASDILLVIDRAGTIAYAGPSVERLLGYRPAELIGKNALGLIVPDDRARAVADFNSALETSATPLPNVFRVRHKDGAVRILEGVGKNLLADPAIAGFVINVSDVTELYGARVRQRETTERLQMLFEANPTGLWLVHARTRTITSANPAALLMMGRSEAEVLGQVCHRFICPEGRHGCPVLDQNLPVDRSERELIARDGREVPIMKTVVRVTIGDEPYLLESFVDMTEHRRAQQQVRQSREAAERLTGELELLAGIGRVVSSTLELDRLFGRFAAEVRKRISFDRFDIHLCNPDRETIRVAHVSGVAIADRREGESHPLEGTLSAEVLRTRRGVLIQQEGPDELRRRFPRIASTLQAGLRSLLAVPLLYRDHPIGVLHFRSKEQNAYGPSDLRLAEQIGTQAAGAIANAEAFGKLAETEKALRENEQRLQSILEGSSIATFVIGKDHRVLHWNRALAGMSSIAAGDVIGTREHWRAFYSAERPCMADLLVDEAFAMLDRWYPGNYRKSPLIEDAYETTAFFPALAEGGKWLHLTAAAIRNSRGAVVAAIETMEDVTESRLMEMALRASAEKQRTILQTAMDGFWIVDRAGALLDVNETYCRMSGYDRNELLAMAIPQLEALESKEGIAERIAGIIARGTDRFESRHRRKDGSVFDVEVSVQHRPDAAGEMVVFLRDISRRRRAEAELRQSVVNLRKAFGTTVQVMAAAVEAKDPYTAGHQLRTADLARAIATEMGLSPDVIEGIRMAGTIHDIGKLSIPAEILSKPTKLSGLEFSLIQEHCRKGFEMLKDVASPWPLAGIVLQHHERIDGSGYPEGLKGDGILLEARILTVADVVEAMASHRPYRPGLGIDAALNEIETHAGTFYDSGAVAACLRLFREKGFQLS